MRFFKISLISLLIISLSTFVLVFYILWKFSPDLPSYDKLLNYKPNLSSRVYSSDGRLLKSFYIEERIFVPIDRIPELITQAYISSEDKNFFYHYGIDFFAIARAFFTNIISYYNNEKVVGASTITQQVVKNLLLSNEVSYERKIKEIILAIRIENILSKDKILELYLNDIYLGYGSYGIATASLNYFNKSIYELELHEIAFLAALPKAPNNYNPITKYAKAIERRNWVIDRLYINGYISEKDLEYKNKSLDISKRTYDEFNKADYYYEEIRKYLYNKYGKSKLYSDGLIVKSSINSELQNLADESLIEGLIKYDRGLGWRGPLQNEKISIFKNNIELYNKMNPFENKWFPAIITKVDDKYFIINNHLNENYQVNLNIEDNKWLLKEQFTIGDVIFVEKKIDEYIVRQIPEVNGGIVVMNPHNGDVLALSGGFSFKISEFNRATQAKRQPGSAFKPFVYMAALKEGLSPSTLVLDAPYVVDQGPGLPKWKPANYTEEFYGLTTMRTGIEKSRNLMTVRLADKIGMNKIIDIAKDFGIEEDINDQLSMSLGSGLVTLIDITNAYAIISNGGIKIEPRIINSIYSKEGRNLFNSNSKECINCKLKRISKNYEIPNIIDNYEYSIDPKIAYQITTMMEGVVKRGTAKKLKELNVPIAGKTGTTNDNKDAWFIGYTPNLVIGIYVGYDTPKSLGFKQTGSSVAVPIFKILAKKININSSKIPFRVPSGVSFVKIDPKTGMPSNNENSILETYILGSEPYNQNFNKLDMLGKDKNNSISGTGGLLN